MIHIKSKAEIDRLYFPVNTSKGCGLDIHTLRLKGTTSQMEYEFEVEDIDSLSDFVVCMVDLSSLEDGEYEYSLDCDSHGLLVIGDHKHRRTEFDASGEIKQYNFM